MEAADAAMTESRWINVHAGVPPRMASMAHASRQDADSAMGPYIIERVAVLRIDVADDGEPSIVKEEG